MSKRTAPVLSTNQAQLETIRQLQVLSSITSRMELASRLGLSYSGVRDIYKAFGYKKNLEFSDYWNLYDRGDISKKVVEAAPDASWRISPKIEEDKDETSETDFEASWSKLQRTVNIFHHLHCIDVLSGIGHFGVLFLGFDDGQDLSKEVVQNSNLVYLQSYKEDKITIRNLDEDIQSPRYGKPLLYSIQLGVELPGGRVASQRSIDVHYSRVLHIAEGKVDNQIYGTPRMKSCFNRLQNVELIAGSCAEMWYRGAFPGYNFKMDSDAQVGTTAIADMKDQIEEYMHDFKRYLRLKGVDVKAISPQVSDPGPSMDVQFKLLSASTGIPARILFGSERGELASSQDEKNWLDKINFRRTNYCEPFILRPLIDHLMRVGVLPQVSQYSVRWPELIDSSELDKASAMERVTAALTKYADSLGAQNIFPPAFFYSKIMKMDAEDIKQIIKDADQFVQDELDQIRRDQEILRQQQQDGGNNQNV